MKFILQFIIVLVTLLTCNSLFAQTDSIWQKQPQLNVMGFADVFYVYDFNQPQGSERQPFLFNHNRHNEFNLNLGLIKMDLTQTKYRATFALHTGTYGNDNYAAEPGLLKNIFEANIGVSLNKDNSLWLDAGVLPSHIGFESAISMDNLTLTRSLCAENSPYFLTGAKLTFTPSEKLEMAVLMVNGWQRIQRLPGNSLPSLGTQLTFIPADNLTFNWSTFIGTDDPDNMRRIRFFNNLYGQIQVTEKLHVITGFDIGAQQRSITSSQYDVWFTPIFIGQYALNQNWKTAVRAEYYQDATGIIITTGGINGFRTTGLSWNLDYAPSQNIVWRIEGRWLSSRDNIFDSGNGMTNNNFIIGTSLAIKYANSLTK